MAKTVRRIVSVVILLLFAICIYIILVQISPTRQKIHFVAGVQRIEVRSAIEPVIKEKSNFSFCSKSKQTKFKQTISKSKHGIPFILHQIYKSTTVPTQYEKLIRGCREVNKDFVHVVWTDDDGVKFIKRHFPEMAELQKRYKGGADKSDFLRIFLLYHFGGVYLDMDVECRKPLSQNLDQFDSSCIIDREREMQTKLAWNREFHAMNSVMISRPNHPFLKFLIDKLPETVGLKHVLWRTGPVFLTNQYVAYSKTYREPQDRVLLAPHWAFTPLIDQTLPSKFDILCRRRNLGEYEALGCKEWKNEGRKREPQLLAKSIMVHQYLHIAYGYIRIKNPVDVCATVFGISRWTP